jgi:hypothetical protein
MFSLIDIGIAVTVIVISIAWFCVKESLETPSQTPPSKTDEIHDAKEDLN